MTHARAIPRYLVVGGCCAVLNNVILVALDRAGVNYVASCLVSFAATVLVAYAFHTRWTFGADRSVLGLLRYGAAMSANLPFAVVMLFVLVSLLGLPMVVAAPALTVIQTAFNYVVAATLLQARPQG